MVKRKRTKVQTRIYKTLHRKLQSEQNRPHYNPGMASFAAEVYKSPIRDIPGASISDYKTDDNCGKLFIAGSL